LPWADYTFDVVLVMGALYHLQDRDDRLACLREAHRVLKPGGALVASYISRWASLFDGYRYGFVADGRFAAILDEDLSSGRHQNAFGHPLWFTSSYFHTPDELVEGDTPTVIGSLRLAVGGDVLGHLELLQGLEVLNPDHHGGELAVARYPDPITTAASLPFRVTPIRSPAYIARPSTWLLGRVDTCRWP
jgi:SAM-dependent methyltransferase